MGILVIIMLTFIFLQILWKEYQEAKLDKLLDNKHVYTIGRLDVKERGNKGGTRVIYHFSYNGKYKVHGYWLSRKSKVKFEVDKKYVVKLCPDNVDNSRILLTYPIDHDSFLMGDTISRMRLGLK